MTAITTTIIAIRVFLVHKYPLYELMQGPADELCPGEIVDFDRTKGQIDMPD